MTHRLVKQHCHHGTVHAATESAYYFLRANSLPQVLHSGGHERLHCPGRFTAARAKEEILQNLGAVGSMGNLRVELNPVKFCAGVAHCGHRGVATVG